MKILILFLISFNLWANYIPKNKVGVCESLTVHSNVNKCGQECIKIDQSYNCNYSQIDSEKWLKEQAESCLDESDCQSKLESLSCLSDGFSAIKTESEVYCTKYQPERVISNQSLKAAYEAQKQAEKDAKQAIKDKAKAVKALGKKWKQLSDKEQDDFMDYMMDKLK